MHVGAGNSQKLAPMDEFLKTVQFYKDHFQIRLFITEGPADQQIVSEFLSQVPIDVNAYIFKNESLDP